MGAVLYCVVMCPVTRRGGFSWPEFERRFGDVFEGVRVSLEDQRSIEWTITASRCFAASHF